MSADIAAAAEALLEARRTRRWLAALPEGARPGTDAEAYAIQDRVVQALGEVGGWKVGAATPDSEPFRGPIQATTIFADTERVPANLLHVIGVEAELAYRFNRDLPPRDTPYTRDEVLDAIGTLHPVIEISRHPVHCPWRHRCAQPSGRPPEQRGARSRPGTGGLAGHRLAGPARTAAAGRYPAARGRGRELGRRQCPAADLDGQSGRPLARRAAGWPDRHHGILQRDRFRAAGNARASRVSRHRRHRHRNCVKETDP